MSIIDRIRYLSKKEKIIIASVSAVIVIAVIAVIVVIANNRYLATTMRLLRVEGTVNIEDSTGSTKPVIDNIRFQSGDALSTGADGLASVGLDDTKIVTLENDSRVEFVKQGKQLELTLTQGALFFEVTEKLADDETYEIKTSNMTVGIRGTSGYVYYSESGLQSLIITDGIVKVTGYNPKTQETKVVEVRGGEQVTAYLYDEATEERDSIEFEVKEVPVEELPEFPLQMLAENDALLEKVCADTGWDKDELLALVEALTVPDNPTPTPDEIIEITETPTPTAKPTSQPTLTPTPTDTATPSPTAKPLASATGTPTPGAITTPGVSTTTPTATPTVTTTPSVTPIPTTTVKPTATPTVTTTPKPTATPTVATYTVTFITNGKCDAPATQTVTEGGKATKPANPSAEGYTFGGWYRDSACTNAYNFNSAVTSNIVLYAKWTHISYTVTFDTGGLGTAPESQTVNHGGKVERPDDPSAEGYTFTGWYTDEDCTEDFEYAFESRVTSDITLYAGWSRITYTVSFDTDGKGTAPGSQTINYGESATQPADPSAEGYAFGGWYTEPECVNIYSFGSAVTSDIKLYAKWTLAYTVIFDKNGHGQTPDAQIVIQGGTATYIELSETNYYFGGWYTDPSCKDEYWFDFNTKITLDITLYAKWTFHPPYPGGYNYYLGGNKTYNGHEVLVLYQGYTDPDYIGWLNNGWVKLTYATDEQVRPYFTVTDTGEMYFHY